MSKRLVLPLLFLLICSSELKASGCNQVKDRINQLFFFPRLHQNKLLNGDLNSWTKFIKHLARKGSTKRSLLQPNDKYVQALLKMTPTEKSKLLEVIGEQYLVALEIKRKTETKDPNTVGKRYLDRLVNLLIPVEEHLIKPIKAGIHPQKAYSSYAQILTDSLFPHRKVGDYNAEAVISLAKQIRETMMANPKALITLKDSWKLYLFGSIPNFRANFKSSDIDLAELGVNSYKAPDQINRDLAQNKAAMDGSYPKVETIAPDTFITHFAVFSPVMIKITEKGLFLMVHSNQIVWDKPHDSPMITSFKEYPLQ